MYSVYIIRSNRASLGSTLENFQTELDVLDAAIRGDDFHQLGVVGIMFDVVDEDNPAFDAIFDDEHYDHLKYPAHSDDASTVVHDLDLSGLIPEDIGSAGYYAYEGSLTTPPCTNIVRWHVMNARATISAAQLEKFRGLMMDNSTNAPLAPNFREIMPTFNEVYACVDGEDVVEEDTETESEEEDTFDEGWIVAVIAIIAAVVFLVCFILKTWKSNELQKELNSHGAVRSRGRVFSISEDNKYKE